MPRHEDEGESDASPLTDTNRRWTAREVFEIVLMIGMLVVWLLVVVGVILLEVR